MVFALRPACPSGYGARRGLRNLWLALAFCAAAPALAEPVTIVALGDSLTAGYGLPEGEGFVPQLQAWLNTRGVEAEMQNAGVSGDTTAGGLARLDWALGEGADALIVALGGNDVLRGLPPTEAHANLDAILSRAADKGLPVLLIGLPAPGNYGPGYKAEFDTIFPALAASHGALLEPDFLAGLGNTDPAQVSAFLQGDGIHPNAEGVRRIVDRLGPRVLELIARAGG
jgi:acyl-CoA thioesterase-1